MTEQDLIPFDIYWADVPFEDTEKSKLRPVIYLGKENCFLLALYVSSSEDKTKRYMDIDLEQWRDEGLSEPSFVRMEKRLMLDISQIKSRIGSLKAKDFIRISSCL